MRRAYFIPSRARVAAAIARVRARRAVRARRRRSFGVRAAPSTFDIDGARDAARDARRVGASRRARAYLGGLVGERRGGGDAGGGGGDRERGHVVSGRGAV